MLCEKVSEIKTKKMAVDTNFPSSLLEKVKVEDPWLPPRTWESIPSQSGPLRSSSSSRDRLLDCDTSSLSEISLVRLALNALQGVQSSLISIKKYAAAFCSDPADRTFHQIPSLWNRSSSTHALGEILKSIGCLGFLVFLLHQFVDHFRNVDAFSMTKQPENSELSEKENDSNSEVKEKQYPPYSLVNQAFSVAVEKVLEGYVCALDTLNASVGLRHLSKSVDVALHASSKEGCLASVVQSKITLLEVYLHTEELRTHIEALGNICNLHNVALSFSASSFEDLTTKATLGFHSFWRGGNLLTYLYTQLQVADPTHRSLLKFLFLQSCEPYFRFIRSLIFKAEINDPYKEFIVEYVDNVPENRHGEPGTSIDFSLKHIRERDGVSIPCFLKHLVVPLVRAGQQLQVLMKLLQFCDCVFPGDHTYMDFLPCRSGFSSNPPLYASLMTFGKGNIETMVDERNSYYEKMQERLENLLTKLEISFQQVASHRAAPVFFGNGGSSESSVSFQLNDRMASPSVIDQKGLDVPVDGKDSDDSNAKDEFFCDGDTSESSECSSLSGSDEQNEDQQLVEHSNSLCGIEHKYFSALNFSMRTPKSSPFQKSLQHEKSVHKEENSHEICERAVALGHCILTEHQRTILSGTSVLPESGKSDLSCRDGNYADSLRNNHWLLGGLLKNPFCINEGCRNHSELHQSASDLKFCKGNVRVSREGISHYSKILGNNNVLIMGTLVEDQLENGYAAPNIFTMQRQKLNYCGNIFSSNPMLTRNALFHQTGKPGERCVTDLGQSLPYFDFSSVEYPFKVCVEKLAIGATRVVSEDSNLSAIPAERDHCRKQGHIIDENLIDNTKGSSDHPILDLKDHKKGGITSKLSGRSSWESLLSTSNNIDSITVEDHRNEFSAIFEMPLDFIIDKCLLQEILLQYKYVSKLTIKFLVEGLGLHEHLLALRQYHFMEIADWADLFIMSLWNHKWYVTEADHRLSEIQGILELSVQRSSCEQDHNKKRLFVYIKEDGTMPLSTSMTVCSFSFLGLGYQVDWPVNIVLTHRAMKIYADIFSFLIQLKLAVFSLNDIWYSLKDLMHLIHQNHHSTQHRREVDHFNLLIKLRHQVNHFVSTLQQYVHSQISHVSWCKFLHSLKHKVKDMMDLESVHMEYLSDSLDICFLSDETRIIPSIIEGILQCALDFRSCLTKGMWDIQLDPGNCLGKLSRINVSQVLAIKEKFHKNLKELHLCYLKSPKYGEFGLSRFWGYLNYNEYYSDISNGMIHYAFSV